MINKLKILGEYISENSQDLNSMNISDINSANVIVLSYTLIENECEFKEIDIMEYDDTKKNKLMLLKDIKGNKVSSFPTVYIDSKGIEKSMKKINRILKTAMGINTDLKALSTLFNNELENWKKANQNNQDQEESELMESSFLKKIPNFLSTEDKNLLTIKINDKLIGDSEYFKPVINNYLQTKNEKYYNKYNTTSLGKNKNCYLCGVESKMVFGFCDTFKFYSANEDAYIAGGFNKSNTWKNYPICPVCANNLRIARDRLFKNFDRYFYGNKYLMIPSPTLKKGDFLDFFYDLEMEFKDLSLKKENESNQQLRNELEEEIFETFAKQKDQFTFTFFFYRASNSEFKILQEAEDILPSRFQKIINAKKKMEYFDEFKNLKGLYKKGVSHNLSFNFGIIKTFFPSNFNNDFLDITSKIFKGQRISKSYIYHQISEHLAKGFRNEALYHDIEKAMIFLKFLYEIRLIENNKEKVEVKMENKYEDYFQKHPDFYNADWKKGVFLVGVLTQHVMDIQYRERNARPFRSRLNGLKLDARAIKRLIPESIEKLEQYKKNYYRELEETIALLMESGEPELKTQSVDEISFYFAMGMNLNKNFKSKREIEGENHE